MVDVPAPVKPTVFISSSASDAEWRWRVQAAITRQNPGIQFFWLESDEAEARGAWKRTVATGSPHSVVVTLLSPQYLAEKSSPADWAEIDYALAKGSISLFPVLVADCDWHTLPIAKLVISRLEGEQPLLSLSEEVRELALTIIAQRVEQLLTEPPTVTPPPLSREPSRAPDNPKVETPPSSTPAPQEQASQSSSQSATTDTEATRSLQRRALIVYGRRDTGGDVPSREEGSLTVLRERLILAGIETELHDASRRQNFERLREALAGAESVVFALPGFSDAYLKEPRLRTLLAEYHAEKWSKFRSVIRVETEPTSNVPDVLSNVPSYFLGTSEGLDGAVEHLKLEVWPVQPSLRSSNTATAGDQTLDMSFSVQRASLNDQPTKDDELGFSPHVNAVASFLSSRDTHPPLTMSVEGPWGTGKSSFMLQLAEALRAEPEPLWTRLREAWATPPEGAKEPPLLTRLIRAVGGTRPLIVRFDAWRHDKSDQLWATFAIEFLTQIADQRFFLRRWWGHSRLFLRRVAWRGAWLDIFQYVAVTLLAIAGIGALLHALESYNLPLYKLLIANEEPEEKRSLGEKAVRLLLARAGSIGATLTLATTLFIQIRKRVGGSVPATLKKYLHSPDYESKGTFIDAFHRDFEKIVEAYAGHKRVCVFVDDLDRCEVPKAAELMQALNLMISADPRIIFIIGMDREKVAAGIAAKYKDIIPFIRSVPAKSVPPPAVVPGTGGAKAPEPAKAAATTSDPDRALEFGYEFLEKFIQLPFALPKPTAADVKRMLGYEAPKASAGPRVPPGSSSKEPSVLPTTGAVAPPGNAPLNPSEDPSRVSQPALAVVPPPDSTRDADEKKRQENRLAAELSTDSRLLKEISVQIAPALDFNPRRIKQYVNLLRLRAYIAFQMNRLRIPGQNAAATTDNDALTLQQLGKLTAIALRWPLLLSDLEADPLLLASLQAHALGFDVVRPDDPARRWLTRGRLVELLQIGGAGGTMPPDYDLSNLGSVNQVLSQPQTSPVSMTLDSHHALAS